ncbi:Unknown protein [Striga hermonthica]|uniref:Uncharacterized protein n=1 Tax=Striga hermonthica TaxID=68872 RepID=A0A9N7RU11_STRHE|nr:Unknown protein [Striga hermonthica]
MSKIFSCFLVVLLCSSFHTFRARNFQRLHKDAEQMSRLSTSKNNDRTTNITTRVSTQSEEKSSIANATRDAKEKIKTTIDRTKSSSSVDHGKHIEAKGEAMKISGTSRKKPRAQVTWRVPHEKRGEKEPGFNLDYLPPKTHPGIHN